MMFRKSKLQHKMIPINNSSILLRLSNDIFLNLFIFFSAIDLLKLKSISARFNREIDNYTKRPGCDIYYAVSLKCAITMGYDISHADLKSREDVKKIWDFTEFPTHAADTTYWRPLSSIESELLPKFINFTKQDDSLMLLFKTQYHAEYFFNFPRSSLCDKQVVDQQYWAPRMVTLHVSPIYKVQLVHSLNIDKSNEFNTDTYNHEKLRKLVPDKAKASDLIPISATIQHRFFSPGQMETIVDEVSFQHPINPKRCTVS